MIVYPLSIQYVLDALVAGTVVGVLGVSVSAIVLDGTAAVNVSMTQSALLQMLLVQHLKHHSISCLLLPVKLSTRVDTL